MDQFKELEKYKALLDEGAISEDEFRKLKQKTLGLKTDEEKEAERVQARAEALAEVEKLRQAEREKQIENERKKLEQERIENENRLKEETARLEKERQAQINSAYDEEKAKERARLDALQEQKAQQRADQIESLAKATKTTTNIILQILFWILTCFCGLITIACFFGAFKGLAATIGSGISMLLLTLMACPIISKKTKSISQLQIYHKFKVVIVIALIIIFFIFAATGTTPTN